MTEKLITKAHARRVLKEMVRIINRSASVGKDADIAKAFRAIVTALRGPDAIVGNGQLKLITTAIIRGEIGIEHDRSGMLVQNGQLGDVKSFLAENRFLSPSIREHYHFTDHIRQAVAGIRKLGLEKK